MAKFGEGDDRWIVKDLGEQGTNVNNWHWKEYDAFEWSDEKLKSLLDGVTLVESPVLTLRITAVNIKGEAVINNRKNKVSIMQTTYIQTYAATLLCLNFIHNFFIFIFMRLLINLAADTSI
jgi:hypothetical protein